MHYVLYRSKNAHAAHQNGGFLQTFAVGFDLNNRPVVGTVLLSDPNDTTVKRFDSAKQAYAWVELLSESISTKRPDDPDIDPFLGWTALAVEDDNDRHAYPEDAALELA
jgi:hypothetical protein